MSVTNGCVPILLAINEPGLASGKSICDEPLFLRSDRTFRDLGLVVWQEKGMGKQRTRMRDREQWMRFSVYTFDAPDL